MELLHQFNNMKKHSRGQFLLELILAMGLSAIMLPALLVGLVASQEGKAQQRQRIDATNFSKEAYDQLRIVRERGWEFVSINGIYHIIADGNTWALEEGSTTIGGFTISIEIFDVYRDVYGNIVDDGGSLDPLMKKIVITISWDTPYPSSTSSTYYVVRSDNTIITQTTVGDFNAGIKINTQVTDISGGEVKLSPNTKGQWCQPQLSDVTINLPGTPNAVTAVEGHIYVSTGAQAISSQDSFAHILVSNSDPPTFTLHGKVTGYKTNAVFGETDWGYIATSTNTKEVVIINLNQYDDPDNKIYHEEGYFNTVTDSGGSVTTDADTIFVMNNRGYVTAENYLYVFNLDSRSGSRAKIGKRIQFADSGDSAGEIYGRVVNGHTYIFIAIQGSTVEEMKIADVTNPSDSNQWKIVGSINIEPNGCSSLESGKAIFVNPAGTRAYISSTNDASFKEFFIIDTSSKTNPTLIGGFATKPPCTNGGGYEANGMDPEQSVVVSLLENRAILVGLNGEEYQVLNTSDEAHPSRCGGLQYNAGLYGVAAVKEADGDAYAYIITGDDPRKLRMIQGGPDGPYLETGEFESSIIDMTRAVTFNRFDVTADIPAQTTAEYQVAIADPVSGSCNNANFVYVGPDGTPDTKFTAPSALPLSNDGAGYENPGQCVRYKLYLTTTDYNVSPTIFDVTFNFAP
jgi:type II secretory pathway pseudopilin PulG